MTSAEEQLLHLDNTTTFIMCAKRDCVCDHLPGLDQL